MSKPVNIAGDTLFLIRNEKNIMKRKTNLFYTTGTDSNFVTFSNYTEGMTGNFLATNVKLFPSKFLCLNIPNLTKGNRQDFLHRLTAYYENKVAFLRDKCIEQNINIEHKIKSLGYLLDFIYNYDNTFTISFVGQVTEQDYNGTFADTICIIDASEYVDVTITRDDEYTGSYEDYSAESTSYLYGWTDNETYIGPEEYKGITPVADKDVYYYNSLTKKISISKPEQPADITFNCIIPLFDIINTDKNENTDKIESLTEIDCLADDAAVINVPYGIWFANDNVILTRDNTDFAPTWSLAIGSQFKPFPYSSYSVNNISQTERATAFATFSQTLIRQNMLLEKMMNITNEMTRLNQRIGDVESNIKSIGTSYNIDGLHKEMIDMKQDCSYMITTLQKEIDELKS